MAHHSIPEPEDSLPEPDPSAETAPKRLKEEAAPLGEESDLGELAAKFASAAGGCLSAELSADLALEVVLNELVEQACLATGATAAAIILARDGEMVCRARSGNNAPELGARLSNESGLTGECIKERQAQRCNDAQDNPRADMEACKYLGVHSVMILPLLRGGELAGVFEVFSSVPSAFGERDERTLEALAQRVMKNLELAAESVEVPEEPEARPQPVEDALEEDVLEDDIFAKGIFAETAAAESGSAETPVEGLELRDQEPHALNEPMAMEPDNRQPATHMLNVMTWILSAAVFAFAGLLIVVGAERLAGKKAARAHPPATVRSASGGGHTPAAPVNVANGMANKRPGNQAAAAALKQPDTGAPDSGASNPVFAAKAKPSSPPAGGLQIYQNGKEIFHMTPSAARSEVADAERPEAGEGSDNRVVQRAAIYELSPEAAEGSLLHRVEPDYPEQARQQDIQGPVVLEVHTAADGSVQNVNVLSGQPLLADAAISAVKQWRFKPRMIKGQPVQMQTKVTLNFRLPAE